ncbi:MAG: SGNH/GDSL hydrolase family protein [Planctomycetota bacterium]
MPARPRRRWPRLALAAATTAVTLAAAEFGARWFVEGSCREAVESIVGWRGVEGRAAGSRQGMVADDELGFRLSPDWPGVNALGIRHGELAMPKPAGTWRALLVGDSVGFPLDGFFADVRAALTQRSRRPLEFVNACVHGYTTWQERRFLERDLAPLQSDLVVLQYCVNDNWRFLHRLTSSGRRLLTAEARNHLFPDGDGAWPWLTRSSYLVYLVRRALLGRAAATQRAWQGTSRTAWDDASWPEQEANVRAMADCVRAGGGAFVVVAVPHEDQLDAAALAKDAAFVIKPQRALAAICTRCDVPFLDLHGPLLAQREAGLFTDGTHLSPAGHRLAGRELARFLIERGFAPPE